MSVYELIKKRRTIRRFKQKPIPLNTLEKIVDAGRLAPSGANIQPCEFVIVNETKLVSKVFALTKWAGYLPPEQGPPSQDERPTGFVVVLLDREKRPDGGEHDAASAITNMILTALEEGIGACWIGSVERQEVKEILSIPEHCDVDSVLALGFPAESPQAVEFVDSVKYWRDGDGVLHVPKRPLADVLHRNCYRPT